MLYSVSIQFRASSIVRIPAIEHRLKILEHAWMTCKQCQWLDSDYRRFKDDEDNALKAIEALWSTDRRCLVAPVLHIAHTKASTIHTVLCTFSCIMKFQRLSTLSSKGSFSGTIDKQARFTNQWHQIACKWMINCCNRRVPHLISLVKNVTILKYTTIHLNQDLTF